MTVASPAVVELANSVLFKVLEGLLPKMPPLVVGAAVRLSVMSAVLFAFAKNEVVPPLKLGIALPELEEANPENPLKAVPEPELDEASLFSDPELDEAA